MIERQDIVNITFQGKEKTAIRLGETEYASALNQILSGEKEKGIYLKDGVEHTWYYDGLTSIDGQKYVYFDKISITPISDICNIKREYALEIILNLADTLSHQDDKFLNLEANVFPLWRVFIVDEKDLLILPSDLENLLLVMREENDKNRSIKAFTKGGTEAGFSLILQMAELMYFALTSKIPYEDEIIRESGFSHIPLSYYKAELFPNLNKKTFDFINYIIEAKSQRQRDISGNKTNKENVAWFINKANYLTWDVESISVDELNAKLEAIENTDSYKGLYEKDTKSAKRKVFVRKKGALVAAISLAVLIVFYLIYFYVSRALAPPFTKDMEPVEMIYAYYDAHNNLDVSALNDPLKGVKAPQDMEITSLFVTVQTRKAYEDLEPYVNVTNWIEQGKPAIKDGAFIYGVDDIVVNQIGDNVYEATAIWYSPYDYDKSADAQLLEEVPGKTYTYLYKISQIFTFTWNNRGWWNITDVQNNIYESYDVILVDTF